MKTVIILGVVLAVFLGLMSGPASAQLDPDVAAVVRGNNEFALDMFRLLGSETQCGENMLISPYSISSALALTYAGARGDTATEMAEAMHFTLPGGQLHPAFGQLTAGLNFGGEEETQEMNVVNRAWGQEGYSFQQDFLDISQQYYGAEMGRVDFAGNHNQARETINDWVEDQTHGKIKDLFPPLSITPLTLLAITNAIYFRSDWELQFDSDHTHDADFHTESGHDVNVRMMGQQGGFRYAEYVDGSCEPFEMLELPYTADGLSMLVVLPMENSPIGGPQYQGGYSTRVVEDGLTVDDLEYAISRLEPMSVDVELPKFTLESEFNLNEPLQQMGMELAFDPYAADFSGISTPSQLFISDVVHKATISLTEAGTEAAAATGVGFSFTSVGKPFVADRPFLYFIRDDETGSILFMGRVADPSGEAGPCPDYERNLAICSDVDAVLLAANWHKPGLGPQSGDFNNDGFVDEADVALLTTYWQKPKPWVSPHWHGMAGDGEVDVPEPSTAFSLVLLAIVVTCLLAKRKLVA